MSFRTRLLLALLLAVLLPLLLLAVLVRSEMSRRLTSQYERRVGDAVATIQNDLARQATDIGDALESVRQSVVADNRLRRSLIEDGATDRQYLLDYAGSAMRLSGLSMLQLQTDSGRILSSGHFRNEFDRVDIRLVQTLPAVPDPHVAVIEARSSEGPFPALVRSLVFSVGDRAFLLVGGIRIDQDFLRRMLATSSTDLDIHLDYAGKRVSPANGAVQDLSGNDMSSDRNAGSQIARYIPLVFVDSDRGTMSDAFVTITHPLTELRTLQRNVNVWVSVVGAVSLLLVLTLTGWLAARISRPVIRLAEKTSRLDLDRLDIAFDGSGTDEIATLSRGLGKLTERLRTSAAAIKDAERRATLGELARQVNHDIKNGLTPIRNVFRHMDDVAAESPEELPVIFGERRSTIESSMSYLENLAANYGRISRVTNPETVDVNRMVVEIARDLGSTTDRQIETALCATAAVNCDPIAMRRVLENLVTNAIDSLPPTDGRVTIRTDQSERDGLARIRVSVTDNGIGMTEDEMSNAFNDFYTTKETGTGLGLSIVRRIVMDLDGTIDVESTKGEGTTFTVELPGINP